MTARPGIGAPRPDVEPRLPDPSIHQLSGEHVIVDRTAPGLVPVAHRLNPTAPGYAPWAAWCDSSFVTSRLDRAVEARWYAVPCQRCFTHPHAPGHVEESHPEGGHHLVPEPGLAWQVPS